MNCPCCSKPMVKSYTFRGEEFDYCRACKKELAEMSKSPVLDSQTTTQNKNKTYTRAFHNLCPVKTIPTHMTLKVPFFMPSPVGFGLRSSPNIITFDIPLLLPHGLPTYPPSLWLPCQRPQSNDSFFGVNRYMDTTRLAGVFMDSAGRSIEETIIDTDRMLTMEGSCSHNHIFLNPIDYEVLVKDLSKKWITIPTEIPESIYFQLSRSVATVMPDIDCPRCVGYMLTLDTWNRSDPFVTYCNNPGFNAVMRFK